MRVKYNSMSDLIADSDAENLAVMDAENLFEKIAEAAPDEMSGAELSEIFDRCVDSIVQFNFTEIACYNPDEIQASIDNIKMEWKNNSAKCSECGGTEFTKIKFKDEFWGNAKIITEISCNRCGAFDWS